MYALFDTSIDKEGNYLSEDYTFCERWRGLGGKIYADTSIPYPTQGIIHSKVTSPYFKKTKYIYNWRILMASKLIAIIRW